VVVMDQGQIEQAASAREVYECPRTGYVARFMGGQNVLSGTVIRRGANAVTIKSGAREVTLSVRGELPAEGSVFEAAVRRDHVRLSRAASDSGAPGANAVAGRVAAVEYQGTWLKITLEEACGEEFVANVPDGVFFADPLKVGDSALAQWDAGEIHVLEARPRAASPAAKRVEIAATMENR